MDFGRIKNFDSVNYSLPQDHPGIKQVLGGTRAASPKVYVGGVLWADESFVGTIYPEKARPKDYVKFYTRQFNTIELNSTYYRVPEIETIKRWQNVAPPGFKFCPKVHQEISQSSELLKMIPFYNSNATLLSELKEKLGPHFMQMPQEFAPDRLNELLEFSDKCNFVNLAIELRHPAWFLGGSEFNLLCNYLYKNNLSLVITDTPGRRDVLHMRLTNKTTFVRFNANNNHSTDKTRIDEWILRFKEWFGLGLENVYFFIHSPQQLHMPNLTTYFIQQLRKTCGIALNPPAINKPAEPGNTLF